jgi:hypothetical protein
VDRSNSSDQRTFKRFVTGDRLWIVLFGERRPLTKLDLNKFEDSEKSLQFQKIGDRFLLNVVCSEELSNLF